MNIRIVTIVFLILLAVGVLVYDPSSNVDLPQDKPEVVKPVEKVEDSQKIKPLSQDEKQDVSKNVQALDQEMKGLTCKKIVALGKQICELDRRALYDLIRFAPTDRTSLWLKDEIMNHLERQETFPEEYALQLCDMVKDKALDSDLRGYVLQHLRLNFDQFIPEDKTFVIETMQNALVEADNDAGGTALLSLTALQQKGAETDKELVTETAQNYAFGTDASLENRTTALQCCSQLKITGLNDQYKSIIENSELPRGVKLSAVAAFAKSATAEDKEYLEQLKTVDNGFYKKAIDLRYSTFDLRHKLTKGK